MILPDQSGWLGRSSDGGRQPEPGPEVVGPDVGMVGDLLGGSDGQDPSLGEHVNQIAVLQHCSHIVLDQQHGETEVAVQLLDEGEQVTGGCRVQAGGRLVE